jgi:hydroxyethylthiazole kinase-like uncharacterized protein yjeF
MEREDLSEFYERGLVSAERMAAVDRNAGSHGVSPLQLMESAGKSLAEKTLHYRPENVLVLCGRGNNGGDGLVAARYLQHGARVSVLHPAAGMKGPEAAANLHALHACAVDLLPFTCADDVGRYTSLFDEADVIIDALLGTGAMDTPRDPFLRCIVLANQSPATIVAADVPTPTMRADLICAFHRAKVEGSTVVDIGIPPAAELYTGPGDLLQLPPKPAGAHKGEGGEVLVIGGGPYQGAPYLAGIAALRAGADIVRVATPVPLPYPDIITETLAGIRIGDEHTERLVRLAERADVVVCGPGIGRESHAVVEAVTEVCPRCVLDADALSRPPLRAAETLCTPHAGEFARMFGVTLPEDRIARARLVRDHAQGMTLLVKGPVDVISDGTRVRFNRTGSPSMTKGGTGDVLAGIAGALFCRLPAFEAATVAAYVNGRAGMSVTALKGDGLCATDLLDRIPDELWRGRFNHG